MPQLQIRFFSLPIFGFGTITGTPILLWAPRSAEVASSHNGSTLRITSPDVFLPAREIGSSNSAQSPRATLGA